MSALDWTPLKTVIDENESFLISSHVRPDADALGSELGMRAILLAMGKKVTIVNASAPPANLQFMNPPGVILKLNDTVTKATIPQHDVVIIVDTSAWQQLGSMADFIQASAAKRVVIDHHVSSDQLNAIELKDVKSAATGELICEIGEEFGVTFDSEVANWLYAAIATDTGWFRFPSTSARTMKIAARLMDCGAIPHYVYNLVHEQSSLARVRLGGRVLARTQVEAEGRLAWIYADSKEMAETGAVPSDTEGLVNVCLTVGGAEAAFVAVELQTGQIKFSLRSRVPHNVAAVAEQFGGGGHKLASGATMPGPLPTAVDRMKSAFLAMLSSNTEAPVQPAP